jgi:hypothetical protein
MSCAVNVHRLRLEHFALRGEEARMIIRTNTWLFILSALAAAGCTQEVGVDGPSGDVQVGEGSEALQVAFEDFYSETGRLRIYRNVSGDVSMSVTGAIGKDDPVAVGKLIDPSFVVTYQNLRHGVVKVPERLVALEKERKPIQTRPAEMLPTELPLTGEDQTGFLNATCHNFCNLAGSGELRPRGCPFVSNDSWVHVTFSDENQRLWPDQGDISFFWNMRAVGAHHSVWHATWHYNNYPIPPWNWGWDNWPASNPSGFPFLSADSGSGELGTTTHWRFGGCN